MSTPELKISIIRPLDVPLISIAGAIHISDLSSVSAILGKTQQQGVKSVVFDLSNLECGDESDVLNVVHILNNAPKDQRIHLVCSASLKLQMAAVGLRKGISLYSSTDEIAKLLHTEWVSQHPGVTPAPRLTLADPAENPR